MSVEMEVVVDTDAGEVRKTGLRGGRVIPFHRELFALRLLGNFPNTPHIKRENASDRTLVTEYIVGETFGDAFSVNAEWQGEAKEWVDARPYLEQYIAAEQGLLRRGFLYRNLSLDHLIFTGEKAVLVDHEETLVRELGEKAWSLDSLRGTWETMAPEEFRGRGKLTHETATYRTATIAHLALSGELPFPRFSSRGESHHWRKGHAPKISHELPRNPRRVLRVGLDVRPERRHANPAQFLKALKSAYEEE